MMSNPPNQVPPPPFPPPAHSVQDERLWAMFCHLGGLGMCAFPLNVILPLVVWLIKKDEYPLVNDQGKESLNFQLSILIYTLVSLILVLVVVGIVLLLAVAVFDIVMIVIAAIKANEGVAYRYPLTIRFIR